MSEILILLDIRKAPPRSGWNESGSPGFRFQFLSPFATITTLCGHFLRQLAKSLLAPLHDRDQGVSVNVYLQYQNTGDLQYQLIMEYRSNRTFVVILCSSSACRNKYFTDRESRSLYSPMSHFLFVFIVSERINDIINIIYCPFSGFFIYYPQTHCINLHIMIQYLCFWIILSAI